MRIPSSSASGPGGLHAELRPGPGRHATLAAARRLGLPSVVTGGVIAAVTLLLLNALISRVAWKNRKARHLIEGSPTLLVHHGKIIEEHLAKERINAESLHQALREHGVSSISDVRLAVLEIDGSISVLKNDEMPTVERPHHHVKFLSKKNS